eukprot:1158994-Pelagomonas_calceolata.AAC.10
MLVLGGSWQGVDAHLECACRQWAEGFFPAKRLHQGNFCNCYVNSQAIIKQPHQDANGQGQAAFDAMEQWTCIILLFVLLIFGAGQGQAAFDAMEQWTCVILLFDLLIFGAGQGQAMASGRRFIQAKTASMQVFRIQRQGPAVPAGVAAGSEDGPGLGPVDGQLTESQILEPSSSMLRSFASQNLFLPHYFLSMFFYFFVSSCSQMPLAHAFDTRLMPLTRGSRSSMRRGACASPRTQWPRDGTTERCCLLGMPG